MNRKRLLLLLAVAALSVGWICRPAGDEAKRVIGQTAVVGISEASIELLGRVDTGAATTSLHAESVRVEDGMASFELLGPDGRRVAMREPVARTGVVRNSERIEERIYVELTLKHAGHTKRVQVNLNDRSSLTYPLLLGRNWLKDDYLVDVAQLPQKPDGAGGSVDLPSLASQ